MRTNPALRTQVISCSIGTTLLLDFVLAFGAPGAAVAGALFRSGFLVYDDGGFVNSAVIADFNGDGKPDILSPAYHHALSMHFANGDGTFGPRVDAPQPQAMDAYVARAADFDNDGKMDMIWNNSNGQLYVARGHGDGTFDAGVLLDAASYTTTALAVGDLNGDGKPDVVAPRSAVAPPPALGLAVYAGHGDGTFAAPLIVAAADDFEAVALGDFNGDGRLDIVAGDGSTLTLILQNPTGSFAAPQYFGSGAYNLSIADLDGDGHLDVASDTHVYLGHGDGTFTDLGVNANGVAVMALGDFNGDGHQDAVSLGPTVAQIQVALGNGDGTFGPPRYYWTCWGQTGLAVGDLDGDGRSDVCVASWNVEGTAVYFSKPDGTLGDVREFPSNGALTVNLGDLDGDGLNDLVTTESGTITVRMGHGDATFEPAAIYGNPGGTRIALGDLNGDGRADIAVCDNTTVGVRLTQPGGVPGAAIEYGAAATAVAIGDLNGDHVPDLATCSSVTNTISTLIGVGDGTFLPGITTSTPNPPQDIAIGDLDGDGHTDLIVAGAVTSDVSVLLGTGGGAFGPRIDYPLTDGTSTAKPLQIKIGDVNGDGRPDVVALSLRGPTTNWLWTMLGTGTGALGPVWHTTDVLPRVQSMTVADFDRDGRADVAAPMGQEDACAVYLGQSNGTLGGRMNYGIGYGVDGGAVAAGDLGRNGEIDLVATSSIYPLITILLDTHPGSLAVGPAPPKSQPGLALAGARPNPAGRRLTVELTLPSAAPARLELIDLAGRRVSARDVGTLGAGVHRVDLGEGLHAAPGLYFIRLSQGDRSAVSRVTLLP